MAGSSQTRGFGEGWWSVLVRSLVTAESDSWCAHPTTLWTTYRGPFPRTFSWNFSYSSNKAFRTEIVSPPPSLSLSLSLSLLSLSLTFSPPSLSLSLLLSLPLSLSLSLSYSLSPSLLLSLSLTLSLSLSLSFSIYRYLFLFWLDCGDSLSPWGLKKRLSIHTLPDPWPLTHNSLEQWSERVFLFNWVTLPFNWSGETVWNNSVQLRWTHSSKASHGSA